MLEQQSVDLLPSLEIKTSSVDVQTNSLRQKRKESKRLVGNSVGLALTLYGALHPIVANAADELSPFQAPEQTTSQRFEWPWSTPTSTRTPVPTYTPNPTRTPEATPTPQPIEIELPILGKDVKKPSKQAQYLKMNGPAYVRADTGITSSGILLQKGEPIITTGHTITDTANSKFFWYEIVQFNLDGTPIFGNMRSDALNTQNSTMSERIAAELKYGIFADTAPLSRPTSITQLIRNQTAVGGSTEEAARAKSIIDAYWGEPVATDPYNAFKGAIAHAANSPDSEDPTNINPAISPTMYTIIHSDQSVVVYALNINNEGFIHIKSAPNTQGVQQIESMSVVSWSLLVKEEGLEKAQKIAKQVLGVDLSGNSKNVRDFSSALIRNRFFDYGKPVPVQPTATTTPTAPKAPTATPRSEVEKVEGETPTTPELTQVEMAEIVKNSVRLYNSGGMTPDNAVKLSTARTFDNIHDRVVEFTGIVFSSTHEEVISTEYGDVKAQIITVIVGHSETGTLSLVKIPFIPDGAVSYAILKQRTGGTVQYSGPDTSFVTQLLNQQIADQGATQIRLQISYDGIDFDENDYIAKSSPSDPVRQQTITLLNGADATQKLYEWMTGGEIQGPNGAMLGLPVQIELNQKKP